MSNLHTHSANALTANTNHTGSGTNHHLTCDSGGRLYINSDLGLPVNALTDAGANQSLRTDGSGALRVDTNNAFGSVVILKDDSAIGNVGAFSNSSSGKRGQKISLQLVSEGGTTSWTCAIRQSLDNSNWTTTTANINAVPAVSQIEEITLIAPYWSLVFTNTSAGSANYTIKYV